MAKYKLTVKYNDVCELSLASDIPDIIGSEFDQYVKSMLYKKEDWENFETNFKEAARLEYGNLSKKAAVKETSKEADDKASGENADNTDIAVANSADVADLADVADVATKTEDKTGKNQAEESVTTLDEVECDINCIDDALDFNESGAVIEKGDENNITITVEDGAANNVNSKEEKAPEKPLKKEKKLDTLTFADYIENKNINTPLDEFVAGACFLDEISNIKEFSLKQLNAKLYPAFGRLANSEVIENAIERVLIETVKSGATTKYKINENAWNYHNYDLVRH